MSKDSTKDNKDQSDKFIAAAKERGCETSEKQFKDKLKKISKAKPKEK